MAYSKSTPKKSYRKRAPIGRKMKKSARKVAFSKPIIAKIAKQIFHREVENQITIQNLATQAPVLGSGYDFNGTTTTNGYLSPTPVPLLIIGSGVGARKGNKIEPRSLQIRGTITTNAFPIVPIPAVSTLNTPFYVHMFVYTQKGNIFNGDATKILQGGGSAGTSLPFDGTLLKMMYPFNRDLYNIVKHRVFKMACQPYEQNPTIPAANLQSDGWGNGFKMSHMFKIRLPTLKAWKYNDGDTNLPTNQNYFIGFAVVNADGSLNTITTQRAYVNMESVLVFEDA